MNKEQLHPLRINLNDISLLIKAVFQTFSGNIMVVDGFLDFLY